jgi:RNA polymerase sigma factor (sigma-70 family)
MTPARVISISAGRGGGSALAVLSDARLARLAAKGDPRAFAAIYERHHQDIFRYCSSITGNREDASDALQNTMAAALRALRGEQREIALRPWLFRIAHNESVSIIRRRANHVEITEANEPSMPGPHATVAVRERLSGVLADLGALPERQRGALVMRELIGLEYGEIGDALNVSSGGARQAVYEARVALSQSDLGREMACDAARRSISAGDGRVLRGRGLRAHMRACNSCTSFSEQLGVRHATLPGLIAPLPVAASVAILGGLVGGGASVGTGASIGALSGAGSSGFMSFVAGGASQAAGASAVAKGAAAAVAVAVVAGVGTVEVKKAVEAPAPPAHVQADKRGSGAQATRVALLPPRPSSAVRRRSRPGAQPNSGSGPNPAAGGGPAAPGGAPGHVKRAPRSFKRQLGSGGQPVSDPTPISETPAAPAPVKAPPPAAPASPPASSPVQPWQQQYTDGMRQAQLGLQIGGQVYQSAMQLTQKIISGIFPLAQQR